MEVNPALYLAQVIEPPATSGVLLATSVWPDTLVPEHVTEMLAGLNGAPWDPVMVAGDVIVKEPLPETAVVCIVPPTVNALPESVTKYVSVVPALLHVTGSVPEDNDIDATPNARAGATVSRQVSAQMATTCALKRITLRSQPMRTRSRWYRCPLGNGCHPRTSRV